MHLPNAMLTGLALALFAPVVWAQTPPPAATENAPDALPSASPPATAADPAAQPAPPPAYAPPPPAYAPPPQGYAPPPPPPQGYGPPPQGYGYGPPPQGYPYPPMVYSAPRPEREQPDVLPYQDGHPIPDGYHHDTRRSKGLLIAGSITFGVPYLLSVAGAISAEGGETDVLYIPIVGPFILAGRVDFYDRGDFAALGNIGAGFAVAVLILDGVAQAAGAMMLAVGMTRTTPVLVRDDVAKTTVRVGPLPMGQGGMGVGLVGTM